jgi:Protein of unknown function DUF262/Protein of unknown function (DUF1524)
MKRGSWGERMALANLLQTSISDFLELIGNGRRYKVPLFQRDYSWGEEQWEDLWSDIIDVYGHPQELHYMGAIVISTRDEREYEIIDGQQRFATLSVLGLAVISHLTDLATAGTDAENNFDRAARLRARFIGDRDPASLVASSKLELNDNDNPFYQDNLVQLRPPLRANALIKSNQFLWKCFTYFKSKIREMPALKNDGEATARLLSETIGLQLRFIRITVVDQLSAYTVFETLNARGLELTATDLLKNYMFSLVTIRTDREHLQRRWKSLLTVIGAESFPALLRYHLLCEIPKVRSPRLFKMMRDRITTAQDVLSLIDVLERRADVMAAFDSPTSDYWTDLPDARYHVRELKLFRVTQFMPIFFAASEKWGMTDDFRRLVKLIAITAFRYIVIGDQNTNAIEPLSHEIARGIMTGELRRPAHVFSKLRSVYRSDESFVADFAGFDAAGSGQKRRLQRYVLAQLETIISGSPLDWETDPATIEHILPENPGGDWDASFPNARWSDSIGRLGNLTLLEKPINRDIGNATFSTKLKSYQSSRYCMTKQLASEPFEEWTPETLQARQLQMAELARKIWRSDFP